MGETSCARGGQVEHLVCGGNDGEEAEEMGRMGLHVVSRARRKVKGKAKGERERQSRDRKEVPEFQPEGPVRQQFERRAGQSSCHAANRQRRASRQSS